MSSALLLLCFCFSAAALQQILTYSSIVTSDTECIILLHKSTSSSNLPIVFLRTLRLLASLSSSFCLYLRTLSALKYCFASLRFASPSASAFVLAHPISVLKYHFASPSASASASASIHCFSRLDRVPRPVSRSLCNGTSTHRYPHSANLK